MPNVVYSCGALRHHDVLLVPYGIGDANIGFATVAIGDAASRHCSEQCPVHCTDGDRTISGRQRHDPGAADAVVSSADR